MSRKYTGYKQSRLPKESRTIPLSGDKDRGNGLDYGRWYRCWNCGFPCNIDRDSLGGPRDISGNSYQEYYLPADPYRNRETTIGGLDESYVAMEQGADGSAKEVRHLFEVVTSGGCSFCGTKNWLGKY